MSTGLEQTQLLVHFSDGRSSAAVDDVMPVVYNELRELAARLLRGERPDHTLPPTAVVHEAYLRLASTDAVDVRTRGEFMALAACQIRKILVDHARRHRAAKRGGGRQKLPLAREPIDDPRSAVDILALDEALADLAERSPRQSRIVELRFFAGMRLEEVAAVMRLSTSTVKNEWRTARAWLARQMIASP